MPFCFFVSSNVSVLKNKNVQNKGRRISKEVYTVNYSRYSTKVERINWTELKKKVSFLQGLRKWEKALLEHCMII